MNLRHLFCAFICLLCLPVVVQAQMFMHQEQFISWDDFVAEYLDFQAERNNREESWDWQEQLEHYERLKEAPINLNKANKSDLQQLTWLSDTQIDSLLSYRERLRAFASVAELMLVRELSYNDRRWISLFVYAGDTTSLKIPHLHHFWKGKHRIEWRTEIPLYRRIAYGNTVPAQQQYLGTPLAHKLSYRYAFGKRISYGLNFQKDAGEAFLQKEKIFFDASSAYFTYVNKANTWRYFWGDYHVNWGNGLVMGSSFMQTPQQILHNFRGRKHSFRTHSSGAENQFLRGMALEHSWQQWTWAAFAAHRSVDARIENDEIRTFYYTGLHRNRQELNYQNRTQKMQVGGQLRRESESFRWAASVAATWYDRVYRPAPRKWNRHYSQGKAAIAASLFHQWKWRNKLTTQGEWAWDQKGNVAVSQQITLPMRPDWDWAVQVRHFSTAYLAPQAATLQQGSRVQNEQGILLMTRWQTGRGKIWETWFDYFRHPAPAFRADSLSQGFEGSVQYQQLSEQGHQRTLRYKIKTRSQNVANYAPLMEYVTTHRWRWQEQWSRPNSSWTVALDLSAQHRQTTKNLHWGAMLSTRCRWQCNEFWRLAAFAALFRSTDHATRLYAYQPQLPRMGAFPSFQYFGTAFVAQSQYRWHRWECSLRVSCLYHFDRSQLSSGADEILLPYKVDILGLLTYRF